MSKSDISKILYQAAKLTWKNRQGKFGEVITPYDDFSGLRYVNISNLPSGTVMNLGFDGIGTKIEIAERLGRYDTLAYDLFAMVCDDAVVRGAEPVLIGSVLDVNNLKLERGKMKQLVQGYVNAAKEANVVVVNGETAELGERVNGHGPFNINWSATVAWFANKDKMFTGKQVVEGDYLRVEGNRQISKEARAQGFYAKQEKSSKFLKQIGLPVNVMGDLAKKEFLGNKLIITIPKQ